MIPRRKIIAALVYGLVLLLSVISGEVHGQSTPKAIVLAWDGAVPAFVHDMLRAGKLPNLAKLIEGGACADDVIPVYPSYTAPGFASLMTGAPPRVTGISGNRVPRLPRDQFTILDSAAGFSPALLGGETVLDAAERAGRKVAALHMPFSGEKSQRAVHFQGYAGIAGHDGIVHGRNAKARKATSWLNLPASETPALEISFTIGASTLFGLLIDDPADPQSGYDTLLVAGARDGRDVKAVLKPALAGPGGELFWSPPIVVNAGAGRSAASYLRLFDLKADGGDFFLYYTRPTREVISHPELLDGASATIRAFVGNGASLLYQQGALGRIIANGGDGTAEARYLETVTLVQHQLMETNRWALDHLDWDLYFAYLPYPDEAEHAWRGYLDDSLPGFRAEVAGRLRPFLEQVYRLSDDLLGLLTAKRPENSIVALISDHGMEGSHKLLAINKVLQQAGLLQLDAQGRVDLAKTKVLYPAIDNGYLLINSTSRKNGIVPAAEREDLVRRLRRLLLALRDGDAPVITGIYDAQIDGAMLGIGGDAGGDIYLDLVPGYELAAKLNAARVITKREPHGMHGFNPARPSMRTVMVLNGPGVKAGTKLRDVKIVDFAPTLAWLLGIPTPKNATGRVLFDALADPH